jgi:hypothetical protein
MAAKRRGFVWALDCEGFPCIHLGTRDLSAGEVEFTIRFVRDINTGNVFCEQTKYKQLANITS